MMKARGDIPNHQPREERMGQIFSPFTAGNIALRNRVVFLPFQTAYATHEGAVTPQLLAYYERMANSGAGMTIVEATAISPEGASGICPQVNGATLTGLSELAAVIKNKGSKAIIQLVHGGRFANVEAVGPSPVDAFGRPVRELTVQEIRKITADFALAAKRMKEAGFDGVELHGATGYLLSSFTSPRTNVRADEYGGSLESRMRFPLEVAAAVREAVGEDYPVGYRFMAMEFVPGGLVLEESAAFAQKLVLTMYPMYLSVAGGTYECYALPKMQGKAPEMYMTGVAGAIKQAVPNVAIITAGHLQTPANCEKLVEEGTADLIGLARVLFADADWLHKATGQMAEDIRACIQCNNCLNQIKNGKPSFCARWTKDERQRNLKDIACA